MAMLLCRLGALLFSTASGTHAQDVAPASAKHPLTIRETLGLRRPSSVQIAPDGRHVAYVVTQAVLERNQDHAILYLAPIYGPGAPRSLAEAIHLTAVRWSAD